VGNGNVLYDPRCSRSNLAECMDMGHHVVSPFLRLFFCDGDFFRYEVLVVRHGLARRWMGVDGYTKCTRLARICSMASVVIRRPDFFFCKSEVQPELSSRPESDLSGIVSFRPIPRHWGGHTTVENNDAISLLAYQLYAR